MDVKAGENQMVQERNKWCRRRKEHKERGQMYGRRTIQDFVDGKEHPGRAQMYGQGKTQDFVSPAKIAVVRLPFCFLCNVSRLHAQVMSEETKP